MGARGNSGELKGGALGPLYAVPAPQSQVQGALYLGLGILSAAAIAFEITLTRLFSITQWYHFAFLAVSVALLGYGASGTALSLVPRWTRPPTTRRAATMAVLFALTVIGAFLSLNHLPFDSYRIAWERIQVLYLVLYYLALTVPFFCAGLVTGLLLSAYPDKSAHTYAANLMGSAMGGLVPVLALPLLGEGTVLLIAALGLLAALVFEYPVASSRNPGGNRVIAGLLLAAGCTLVVLAVLLPAPFRLQLSPYKGLSQVLRLPDASVIGQRWNAFSRVDHVASSAIRSAPGLSLSFPGKLPPQDGLFVDGDDLSPVFGPPPSAGGGQNAQGAQNAEGADSPDETRGPEEFLSYLPVALPHELRPGSDVLLLEPRGGLDVWAALAGGAASVVAVERNPLLVQAAGHVYQDDRVEVIAEEGRSYARRSDETFDVVHLALSDGYRPVTSGAYSLGERYDLTVEAFEETLSRLRPGGLLVLERWLQLPPSETLRAGATLVEALRRTGSEEPAVQLAVLRSWQVSLILAKNGAYTPEELATIRAFAQRQGLDLVALPDLEEAEANRVNVLEGPLYYRAFQQLLDEPQALYATQIYDVRPVTDDRPFFFHFFKWDQTRTVLAQLGKTWQPWGGSGYFVLIALLAVAVVTSVVLILLPLAFAPPGSALPVSGQAEDRRLKGLTGLRGRVLVYFGLLGLGFLFVEIPLMQRFILFLGQPIYAFAAVVVAVLLFSGLGSLASVRLSPRWTLPVLVVAILLYPLVLPLLFRALLGAPLGVRLLISGLSLAPLGFLMGIPFPGGLAWLRVRAPGLISWAWAVNGCTSVLASVLAAMIALSFGFSWVLAAAALAYAGAWLALR